MLYSESLQIAKSMQKCKGTPYNPIIFESNSEKNLKKILNTNNEYFIDYIHKIGLSVEHTESTINSINSSTTQLTLKTTCFKVDFNDNFVIISPLK